MKLWEYVDIYKLNESIKDGRVLVNEHKYLPLSIYTYSRSVVYDHVWDDVAVKCRGLIVDEQQNIVSRPFQKFFEYADDPTGRQDNHPDTEPQVLEKLNGSLGILWHWIDEYADSYTGIATKGSFHSDHAKWATEWYVQNVVNPQWPDGYTVVFEIICQDIQPHAVKYEKDGLRLIALINIETGEEADYNTLYHWAKINGLDIPEIYDHRLADCLVEAYYPDGPFRNKEGYVLSWPVKGQPPIKAKVKFDDFLEMRRLMKQVTIKQVCKLARDCQFDKFAKQLPKELYTVADGYLQQIAELYGEIFLSASDIVTESRGMDMAVIAEKLKGDPFKSVVFNMLNDKTDRIRDSIYDLIEHYIDTKKIGV